MAEARKTKVEQIVKVDGVELVLTPEEVRTLRVVCSRVGGASADSPRKHMDSINRALEKAMGWERFDYGVNCVVENNLVAGDVEFKKYGEEW